MSTYEYKGVCKHSMNVYSRPENGCMQVSATSMQQQMYTSISEHEVSLQIATAIAMQCMQQFFIQACKQNMNIST